MLEISRRLLKWAPAAVFHRHRSSSQYSRFFVMTLFRLILPVAAFPVNFFVTAPASVTGTVKKKKVPQVQLNLLTSG